MTPDYESTAMDWLDTAGMGNEDATRSILRAQVYATLALVQAVQDLVIPMDQITESFGASATRPWRETDMAYTSENVPVREMTPQEHLNQAAANLAGASDDLSTT